MTRAQALRELAYLEAAVEIDAFAGSGHPDLVQWKRDCLNWRREKLVRKLCGDDRPVGPRPAEPEVDWDDR